MPRLPIICTHCGTTFFSGLNIQPGGTLYYLSGTIQMHCPHCGRMTSPTHGVYQGISDVAIAFSQKRLSESDLRRLAEKLRILVDLRSSPERVAKGLESEKEPEIQHLADVLPKTRAELYLFLGLLIQFLMFLAAFYPAPKKPDEPRTIINNFYESLEKSGSPDSSEPSEPPERPRSPC